MSLQANQQSLIDIELDNHSLASSVRGTCPPDTLGDMNSDNSFDVLDIISIVSLVLSGTYHSCADVNGDGNVNVLDIVKLVGMILNQCPDADGDGYDDQVCGGNDCDDNDSAIHPNAFEVCDFVDNNCNNIIDEGYDNDGDGYTTCDGDCDNYNYSVNPGATEVCDGIDNDCMNGEDDGLTTYTFYYDGDNDSYGLSNNSIVSCGATGLYTATNSGDCNDSDIAMNPGLAEVCGDNKDNDCNGQVDENMSTFYRDADGDIYGDSSNSILACSQPSGYVQDNTDCNDTNQGINPGATEVCDGIDNDCMNGEDDGLTTYTFYYDGDNDSYGLSNNSIVSCGATGLYTATNSGDCNDSDIAMNPGLAEVCGDNKDNDCNGQVDENMSTFYRDADGDTYGDSSNSILACSQPSGYVQDNTDCNDANQAINPGATEVCDGIDNDCMNGADDGLTTYTFYYDGDNDSYGLSNNSITDCGPTGFYTATNPGDCNDSDTAMNPGLAEVCDGVDNNCINGVDDIFPSLGTSCSVGMGVCENIGVFVCNQLGTSTECSVQPGPPSGSDNDCNDIDDDCDGVVDDGYISTSSMCGVGACAANGQLECLNGAVTDTCSPGSPFATDDATCDGIDNDCDGQTDEDVNTQTDPLNCGSCNLSCSQNDTCMQGVCVSTCLDADGDGYNDEMCGGDDCNDADPAINPGAIEVCGDSKDNNCNGQIDEGFDLQYDPNNCGACGNICPDDGNDCTNNCHNGNCVPYDYSQSCIATSTCVKDYVCTADDNTCNYSTPDTGATCNDGNECTSFDVCDGSYNCAGSPEFVGTPCSSGSCDGYGNCVECLVVQNCDDANECTDDSCNNNTCTNSYIAVGDVCTGGHCDGAGMCIPNTAPVITSVMITPDPAYSYSNLNCSAFYSDPDVQVMTFTHEWFVNFGVTSTTTSSFSGAFVYDDEIECCVTANDGLIDSLQVCSSLTITNTPPSVAGVTIGHTGPAVGNPMTCSSSSVSDDDGHNVTLSYEWFAHNGALQISNSQPSHTYTPGTEYSNVTCQITPNDGIEDGDTVTSLSVDIEECYTNGHCSSNNNINPSYNICHYNDCVECINSSDCNWGEYCNSNYECW